LSHGCGFETFAAISGDTGIGELGLTLTPSKNLFLSLGLGVLGYTPRGKA